MTAFLRHIVLFILFLIPIYLLSVCVWGGVMPSFLQKNIKYRLGGAGHLHSRLQEARQAAPVDLLFIGSSHVYRGFDTRLWTAAGFSSFNLGSSAQTPVQTKVLLERYLTRFQPRLVVFEVYPTTLTLDGVESSLDVISNDANDAQSWAMAFKTNNIKVYNTLIYSLFRASLGLDKNFKEAIEKGDDRYISGGYVESRPIPFVSEPTAPTKWGITDADLAHFEAVLALLKAQNIPYILVQAPVATAYYRAHTDNADFDALMATKGTYYSFNGRLPLVDSLHFLDKDHLNQAGVSVFNAALIPIIKEKMGR